MVVFFRTLCFLNQLYKQKLSFLLSVVNVDPITSLLAFHVFEGIAVCYELWIKKKDMNGTNLNETCDPCLKFLKTVVLTSRCGCSVVILDTNHTPQFFWDSVCLLIASVPRNSSDILCHLPDIVGQLTDVFCFPHIPVYSWELQRRHNMHYTLLKIRSQFNPHNSVVIRK